MGICNKMTHDEMLSMGTMGVLNEERQMWGSQPLMRGAMGVCREKRGEV